MDTVANRNLNGGAEARTGIALRGVIIELQKLVARGELDSETVEIILSAIRDRNNVISKLRGENSGLRRIVSTDKLTLIMNRDGLESSIFGIVNESAKIIEKNNAQIAYMCVAIDLDDFKPVNDKFGHDGGDEVLKVFANILSTTLREHDVLAMLPVDSLEQPRSVEARSGGDEFLAVLPFNVLDNNNFGSEASAVAISVIKKIKSALRKYKFVKRDDGKVEGVLMEDENFDLSDNELRVGASISTEAVRHDKSVDVDSMKERIYDGLRIADESLKLEKSNKGKR